MDFWQHSNRIVNRLRRVCDSLAWVEQRGRSRLAAQRWRLRNHHHTAGGDFARSLLSPLRRQGFCFTSLAELAVHDPEPLMSELEAVAVQLARSPLPIDDAEYTMLANYQLLLQHPLVIEFGISPQIMTSVERYLGVPIAYHGPYVRRDFARRSLRRSRLWHLDLEDHRMTKLVILIRDVGPSDGPLELVPAPLSRQIVRRHRYRGGWIRSRYLHDEIAAAVPQSMIGPAGTAALVDTSRVLHRGGPIASGRERFTVFYDYTTARPYRPYYCKSLLNETTIAALPSPLSERQRRCLEWRRG